MEDATDRISKHDEAIREHGASIGKLQGQYGIIIALQLAQVAGVIGLLVKVFGG